MGMFFYFLLFGFILKVESPGTPYIVFIISGLAIWSVFDFGVMWATRSLEIMSGVSRRIYIAPAVIVFSGHLLGLVAFGVCFFYLISSIFYFRSDASWMPVFDKTIFITIPVLFIFLIGFAISLLTAILDTFGRDMRYSLRYILQVWMFLTPIVYPAERVPEIIQPVLEYNPLTNLVVLFRSAMYEGDFDWHLCVYPAVFMGILFSIILPIFSSFSATMRDRS